MVICLILGLFLTLEPVRNVATPSKVLSDIESHLKTSKNYENKITEVHENTHAINSNLRMGAGAGFNGFYVLENRAIILSEPKVTMNDVFIPESLRGVAYELYFLKQNKYWNEYPLYVLDEWVAYSNGTEYGRETDTTGWYFELLHAQEFNVYCLCLAKCIKEKDSNYDDTKFKAFLKWNTERVFKLSAPFTSNNTNFPQDKNPPETALKYIKRLQDNKDAEELRKFARDYFGEKWCKEVYGF